jgi:hypothetical protein
MTSQRANLDASLSIRGDTERAYEGGASKKLIHLQGFLGRSPGSGRGHFLKLPLSPLFDCVQFLRVFMNCAASDARFRAPKFYLRAEPPSAIALSGLMTSSPLGSHRLLRGRSPQQCVAEPLGVLSALDMFALSSE